MARRWLSGIGFVEESTYIPTLPSPATRSYNVLPNPATYSPIQGGGMFTVPDEDGELPVPVSRGISDIRDWNESRFGISAERLRNCILYQLDRSKDSWFRERLSVSSMNTENFVKKLDRDTPSEWTPNTYGAVPFIPDDLVEYLMKGPGINEPITGWTSAQEKWAAIKRSWYGIGWESKPDPSLNFEEWFTFYQNKIMGINPVSDDDDE
jgi:hypothetical protein